MGPLAVFMKQNRREPVDLNAVSRVDRGNSIPHFGDGPHAILPALCQRLSMSGFKEPSFADRQKAALQAKKDILNKFRAQPGPDDPAVKQRQAERAAQAAARAEAKRLRDLAKAEETARETEAARLAAEQLAREKADAAAREAELEAERKAARDARYAARKARGKKK